MTHKAMFAIPLLSMFFLGTFSSTARSQLSECSDQIEDRCEALNAIASYPVQLLSQNPDPSHPDECKSTCIPLSSPPPPPQISCLSDGMAHFCEIWPRGPSMTYTRILSFDGVVSQPVTSNSPYFSAHCERSGTYGGATIQVTAPNGMSSTNIFILRCEETVIELGPPID